LVRLERSALDRSPRPAAARVGWSGRVGVQAWHRCAGRIWWPGAVPGRAASRCPTSPCGSITGGTTSPSTGGGGGGAVCRRGCRDWARVFRAAVGAVSSALSPFGSGSTTRNFVS